MIKNSRFLNLDKVCVYNAKCYGDEFVGIKMQNGELRVQFPVGYRPADTDIDRRKDILNLISVLSNFSDNSNSFLFYPDNNISEQFPIHAYLHLVTDYMNNGYYREKEFIYKNGFNGKINWHRTIREIKPCISGSDICYLNVISKRINYNETEFITQIHKYCVYEAFSRIGFIFTSFMPLPANINFNAGLFKTIIKSKMDKIFNEKTLLLFKSMLDIIDYLDSSGDSKNFYFGTQHFEYVWERLVDKVYGIQNKEEYYPKVRWTLTGNKDVNFSNDIFRKYSLRPDTIMITDDTSDNKKIFVLDSKYYKFGVSDNAFDLPGTDSVIKQIAYAKFIDNRRDEFKVKSDNIYNAFIMPYNSTDGKPKLFGYATSDSENNEKRYDKICGILLDIKDLMYNHEHNDKVINKLADIIIEQSHQWIT